MELFDEAGLHVVVDGQFGSTGKGLYASYLAEQAIKADIRFATVLSNGGPNSGHTFYHEGEKHVLKQLPSFGIASLLRGVHVPIFLTAGAIIDPAILIAEARKYPDAEIWVHPNAAVITTEDKLAEADTGGSIAAVAGTRSGTGAALARKVFRDPDAIFKSWWEKEKPKNRLPYNIHMGDRFPSPARNRLFMEVSQGFSLGINSQFYPKVTSRECTVMQGIADARIAPKFVKRTYMVIRTYPIRVGNVDGFSSGDMYTDQHEVSWGELGVPAELTTVTQRERRVFTFSVAQLIEALQANQPDFVLLNFMNYLPEDRQIFMENVMQSARQALNIDFQLHTGFGPNNNDVVPF